MVAELKETDSCIFQILSLFKASAEITFVGFSAPALNVFLKIYHIKIICEYLWKDTTQQLLGLHDAKLTNTYEIMCMRGEGKQLGFTTVPIVIQNNTLKDTKRRMIAHSPSFFVMLMLFFRYIYLTFYFYHFIACHRWVFVYVSIIRIKNFFIRCRRFTFFNFPF